MNTPGHPVPSPGLPHPQGSVFLRPPAPRRPASPPPARSESCFHPREPCGRGAAGEVSRVSGSQPLCLGRASLVLGRCSLKRRQTLRGRGRCSSQCGRRVLPMSYSVPGRVHVVTAVVAGGETEAPPSGWHKTQTSSHPPMTGSVWSHNDVPVQVRRRRARGICSACRST